MKKQIYGFETKELVACRHCRSMFVVDDGDMGCWLVGTRTRSFQCPVCNCIIGIKPRAIKYIKIPKYLEDDKSKMNKEKG